MNNFYIYKTKRRVIAFMVLFLVLSGIQAEAKKALLIGIEEYPHFSKLHGPVQDVNNMEQFITSFWGYKESDVRKLINSDATRNGILRELTQWLVESNDEEVLFYYSGHGWYQKDTNGDEQDGNDETIAPYDTRLSEGILYNMISDDEIAAVAKRLQGRKAVFIFDSCHSGTISRGLRIQKNKNNKSVTKSLDPFSSNKHRSNGITKNLLEIHRKEGAFLEGSSKVIVWSAVASSQKAFTDIETNSGSVFTNRFIVGAQGGKADFNNDGIVSNSEQLTFLRQESKAFCTRNQKECELGLTPMLEISKELYGQSIAAHQSPQAGVQESDVQENSLTENVSSVLAEGNKAEIQLTIREGTHIRLGETVTIECRSSRSGYLILLDINAAGEMIQVFPNQYGNPGLADNYVAANTSVVIPGKNWGFVIEANPPLGKSTLIAILTEDRIELTGILNAHKDLNVINAPALYLSDVVSRLQSVWTGDDVNRAVRWSKAVIDYFIEP